MFLFQIRNIFLLLLLSSLTPKYIQCSLLAPVYSTKMHIIKAITAIFKSDPIKSIGNINIYGYYDEKARYKFNDLFIELTRILCVETCYIHLQSTVVAHHYEHSNLVIVDTLKSLRYLYESLFEIGTQNLAYTMVYISSVQDPQDVALQNVFQQFYAGSILNVGIIIEMSDMSAVLMSYNPFGWNTCHLASPFVLNTYQWEQQRWSTTEYFPHKLNDFQQCPITYATWEDHPYFWITYDDAGKFAGYEGIEGKLLEFLGETLNISMELYMMNDNEKVEVFNLTGWVFNEIFQTAHFAFGAFNNRPDENNMLPFSQSDWYFMSSVYFVVTVMSELSSYEKLTLPFSELVWYLTILSSMLGVLVIFVARFARLEQRNFIIGPNNRAAYYKLFSLALGGNLELSQLPGRNFARFLLMLWLLATLVLRSAYQSGIYQLLSTDKQRNPPSSLEGIIAQDYKIESHVDSMDLMEYLVNVKKNKFHYFKYSPLEELERMATFTTKMEKIALLVAHEYYGYFRKLNPISKQVHVTLFLVRQRLFNQQLAFYLRKNSYLEQVFNAQIKKAHNYGFLHKWKSMYVDERVTGETKVEEGDENKPLKMQQLQNIFDILLWFLLVSTGVFAFELIYDKYFRRLRCKLELKARPKLRIFFRKSSRRLKV